jgi:hypothetical protein
MSQPLTRIDTQARIVRAPYSPHLVEVIAPNADRVHVAGCPALRRLVCTVPMDEVPAIRSLRSRTWAMFEAREGIIDAAEARGDFRHHGTPRLTWPALVVKAAADVTSAVVNMFRSRVATQIGPMTWTGGGQIDTETGAALLCLAAEPDRGVPDWWGRDSTGTSIGDTWINSMREWAR